MHLFLAGLRGSLDMMTCAGLFRACAVLSRSARAIISCEISVLPRIGNF